MKVFIIITVLIVGLMCSCSSIGVNRNLDNMAKEFVVNQSNFKEFRLKNEYLFNDTILSDSLKSDYYLEDITKFVKETKLSDYDEITGVYPHLLTNFNYTDEMLKKGKKEDFYTVNITNDRGVIIFIFLNYRGNWLIHDIKFGVFIQN